MSFFSVYCFFGGDTRGDENIDLVILESMTLSFSFQARYSMRCSFGS